MFRRSFPFLLILLVFLILTGCTDQPDRAPVIGEGYVGAYTLHVRDELMARAKTVDTLKHGDRLEIIGRRRRFLKVRTAKGAEGWVDSTQLFSHEDIENLKALSERAKQAPSQGAATVFDPLNVHSAPNRQAPSFFQITPGMNVEVVIHQRAPRISFVPPRLIGQQQSSPPVVKKKKKKEPETPPPPRGPAPMVPEAWMEMSGYPELAGLEEDEALEKWNAMRAASATPSTPVPMDDWTLVRTRDQRAGWVLTRMLFMAIPDEVAQYAERARIVAYFPLGEVTTKDGKNKNEWLWATLSRRSQDVHFDQIRVFTYSVRRDRYETAFIDRNISGWVPIVLNKSSAGTVQGFSFVALEKDGSVTRRRYNYTGGRVRLASKEAAQQPPDWYTVSEKGGRGKQNLPPAESVHSLAERATQLFEKLKKKVAK